MTTRTGSGYFSPKTARTPGNSFAFASGIDDGSHGLVERDRAG